jgi:hypothetical protein
MGTDIRIDTWSGVVNRNPDGSGGIYLMIEQWLDEHGVRHTRAATRLEYHDTWGAPVDLTPSPGTMHHAVRCDGCGHDLVSHTDWGCRHLDCQPNGCLVTRSELLATRLPSVAS